MLLAWAKAGSATLGHSRDFLGTNTGSTAHTTCECVVRHTAIIMSREDRGSVRQWVEVPLFVLDPQADRSDPIRSTTVQTISTLGGESCVVCLLV